MERGIVPPFNFPSFTPSQGFDEYMNVVLDNAEEVNVKTSDRKQLGQWRAERCFRLGCPTDHLRLFLLPPPFHLPTQAACC